MTRAARPWRAADLALPARDLPHAGWIDASLLRLITGWAKHRVLAITGAEQIMPHRDPFILALNHSTYLEAIIVPALLMYLRGGKKIHFLADWHFRMIPAIGLLYRRAGVITVARKPARPRVLNLLKPFFAGNQAPIEAARRHLAAERSLGLFPEGTVNRDPLRLLRGSLGAAQLSLDLGVPVIPAGIRFPDLSPAERPDEQAPFELHVGKPLSAPAMLDTPHTRRSCVIRAHHARIMQEIGDLSGKSWSGLTRENGDERHLAHGGTSG